MSDALAYAIMAALAVGFAAVFEIGLRLERRRWRNLITSAWHEDAIEDHGFFMLANHWMADGRVTLYDHARFDAGKRDYKEAVWRA